MEKDPPFSRWRTSQPRQIRARQLRQEQTDSEAIMWEHLRRRGLDGHKFRRQHPIGQFIVDFCCLRARLVVEIDGSAHEGAAQSERDEVRDADLAAAGYHVVRYTNNQVRESLETVLNDLRSHLVSVP